MGGVFWGCWFFFFTQLFKAVGLNGCFANAIGPFFKVSGFAMSATINSNAKVKILSGDSVKLETFTIEFNGSTGSSNKEITCRYPGRTIDGTITLNSTEKPKIIIYGIVGGKAVKSLEVTGGTNVGSAITLAKDSDDANNETLKLYTTQQSAQNLTLTASESTSGEGLGKAGTFTSSDDAADKLTKMEITLALSSSNPTVDGKNMDTTKVKLTFVFNGGGIAGSGSDGFTVSDNRVDKAASSLEFLGGPIPDFTYGGTFGTVSFNLSLLHLTAASFTTQAYSVGYGVFKCALDSGCPWPTRDFGGVRSLFWRLNYGLKNGYRRFWSLVYVDIISVIW